MVARPQTARLVRAVRVWENRHRQPPGQMAGDGLAHQSYVVHDLANPTPPEISTVERPRPHRPENLTGEWPHWTKVRPTSSLVVDADARRGLTLFGVQIEHTLPILKNICEHFERGLFSRRAPWNCNLTARLHATMLSVFVGGEYVDGQRK